MAITIEKGIEQPPTHCDCCGRATRALSGYASDELGALATYMVQWTDGHVVANGANFDLIVGAWGGAPSSKRIAVSLEYRQMASGPGFTIIDAPDRAFSMSPVVGEALSRSDVVGTKLADEVFAIIDAIWLQDERIRDLRPENQI
ncbi:MULTISPECIES: hypothetical protein [unclassified Brevundimonas]|uniref:hypothetical protein n=1 Tax=unclassified Brevundimonas TaxID=2622653 RepID=UPI0006F4E736|nr:MULTISPECIES: hypothetical protein [unclassified Brevundimonas]KQY64915.1 hypothetical protein ASD25_14900 [Brevundimonas sp. Root1423]KRA26894.1 hypothetical protein ASD59_06065 [Brevundimonas sp. Root608]